MTRRTSSRCVKVADSPSVVISQDVNSSVLPAVEQKSGLNEKSNTAISTIGSPMKMDKVSNPLDCKINAIPLVSGDTMDRKLEQAWKVLDKSQRALIAAQKRKKDSDEIDIPYDVKKLFTQDIENDQPAASSFRTPLPLPNRKVSVTASVADALGIGLTPPSKVSSTTPLTSSIRTHMPIPIRPTAVTKGNIINLPTSLRTQQTSTTSQPRIVQSSTVIPKPNCTRQPGISPPPIPIRPKHFVQPTFTSPEQALDMFYLSLCQPAFPTRYDSPLTPHAPSYYYDAYIKLSLQSGEL